LLAPYIPMLFMGEEYGDDAPFLYFISHSDQTLVDAVREGRKKEFGHLDWSMEPPDPCDQKTFENSRLHWEKLNEEKHKVIHQWYKELIHLRRTRPALQSFDKDDIWVNTVGDTLQLHRRSGDGSSEVVCFFNFSESSSSCLALSAIHSNWKKIIDSNDKQWLMNGDAAKELPPNIPAGNKLEIPPLTVAVYGNDNQ